MYRRRLVTSAHALETRWHRYDFRRSCFGGRRYRTRRFVSVDSSLLRALDLRVKARPLVRVRAVLTSVTPREGILTAAHRRFEGASREYKS